MQSLAEASNLRTKVIKRLRAKLNGDESTNDEENSDTQGERESYDQNQRDNEPSLKAQLLEDIRRNKLAGQLKGLNIF